MKQLFLFVLCLGLVFLLILYNANLKTDPKIPDYQWNLKSDENLTRESLLAYPFEERPSHRNIDLDNLPEVYLNSNLKNPLKYNKTCNTFPDVLDLKYNNLFWQTMDHTNGTFQLLNAYLDDREQPSKVRILGLINGVDLNLTTYCQLWFDNKTAATFANVTDIRHIWIKAWGGTKGRIYNPYLITCDLNSTVKERPTSVSLVETPCSPVTNNLKIHYNVPKKKKKFAVCVKGLSFEENYAYRISEWIELLILLGVDKVFIYVFDVHPTMEKIFDYYESVGKIKIQPITLGGIAPNIPSLQRQYLHKKVVQRRLQEVLPYNDCFYKNYKDYEYIILLDPDEIIVPKNGTYYDLMNKIYKEDITTYVARNTYFLDSFNHEHEYFEDIPQYMHMLQHINRTVEYTGVWNYVKSFHSTSNTLTLHNHMAFSCLKGCKKFPIDPEDAHLQHYREDCVRELKTCDALKQNIVRDTRIWNFKTELIERVNEAIKATGLA